MHSVICYTKCGVVYIAFECGLLYKVCVVHSVVCSSIRMWSVVSFAQLYIDTCMYGQAADEAVRSAQESLLIEAVAASLNGTLTTQQAQDWQELQWHSIHVMLAQTQLNLHFGIQLLIDDLFLAQVHSCLLSTLFSFDA